MFYFVWSGHRQRTLSQFGYLHGLRICHNLQLLWLGSRFGKHCNNYVSKNLRKEKKRNIYTLWHNHKLKLVYSSKLKLITQSNPDEKHYQTIPLVCQTLNSDIKLWLRSFRSGEGCRKISENYVTSFKVEFMVPFKANFEVMLSKI